MQATATIELELPRNVIGKDHRQVQRSVLRHLVLDGESTLADVLPLLSRSDQQWLVAMLLNDAQEALFLADAINDLSRRQRAWSQFYTLLDQFFSWHEHWSEFHNELLAILHTVARRYSPQDLTPERTKLLLHFVQRLHDTHLYQEELFAAKRALQALGLATTLDLRPVAETLFTSYLDELNRA